MVLFFIGMFLSSRTCGVTFPLPLQIKSVFGKQLQFSSCIAQFPTRSFFVSLCPDGRIRVFSDSKVIFIHNTGFISTKVSYLIFEVIITGFITVGATLTTFLILFFFLKQITFLSIGKLCTSDLFHGARLTVIYNCAQAPQEEVSKKKIY